MHLWMMRIALGVAVFACNSPSTHGAGSGTSIGSSVGSNLGSNVADASTSTDADLTKLELSSGERLHDPHIETTWKLRTGTVTATVVDLTLPSPTPPITKLVVWGNGHRTDIIKTVKLCDAEAELRHVADNRIVFHCAIAPVGDEPEARIEDWLVRWSETKNSPLRYRHWRGDPASTEPGWAHATSNSSPRKARRCCCEATLDDVVSHGWELRDDCKADPENEISAECVANAKCRGIKPD